jgi:hypothetical protein
LKKKRTSSGGFVLINALSREDVVAVGPPPDVGLLGFLFTVLALIFLFGGPLLEGGTLLLLLLYLFRRALLLFVSVGIISQRTRQRVG